MCTTVAEAEAMVAAAEKAGTVLMVAYMKRYDPAYRYAQARVREMSDVRFIQVNHLHPDNSLHLAEFRLHRFDDVPVPAREAAETEHRRGIAEALGHGDPEAVPPAIARAYSTILGSMIHDIGNLHGLFGPPARVLSSEIWAEGRGISAVLEYAGEKRAVCTWVDLPELWDFRETLEVYGSRERVLATFPTGFARGLPSTVTLHGMDADRTPWRKELSWHDNPFLLELREFRDCVLEGKKVETDGRGRHPRHRPGPRHRAGLSQEVVSSEGSAVAFDVYDFRTDVRNVVITPEIRSRFLRMEPGYTAPRHSHDLGHEVFLVLDGHAEFEIDGDRAVLGPGQMCFARAGQMHQVKVVGDRPMTMYLSVTPHLEPTHTFWDGDGRKLPPRYGVPTAAERAQEPPSTEPISDLLDRHVAACQGPGGRGRPPARPGRRRERAAVRRALAAGDAAAARSAVDEMWQHISRTYTSLQALESRLERADGARGGDSAPGVVAARRSAAQPVPSVQSIQVPWDRPRPLVVRPLMRRTPSVDLCLLFTPSALSALTFSQPDGLNGRDRPGIWLKRRTGS